MKYYGLDITQHKEFCVSSEDGETFVQDKRTNALPAVLLPEYRHESPCLVSDDPLSRKGLGFPWPRESQIPVGASGQWKNGIGRIPLRTCLSNVKATGDADEWKIIDSQISWKPFAAASALTFDNAKLLKYLFAKLKDAEQCCFVIPEGFGESAQQTLLETFPDKTFLIPRSIALAMKWCADHYKEYQHLSVLSANGESLGHLICASLGFGEWEISLIEILAIRHNNSVYLVPVYDPAINGQGLNFCGIALCEKMLPPQKDISTEQVVWMNLNHSNWFENILQGKNELSTSAMRQIESVLNGVSSSTIPFFRLDCMQGLREKHITKHSVALSLRESIIRQKAQLKNVRNILGIAAGGSFAQIPVNPPLPPVPANNAYMRMDINILSRYLHIETAKKAYEYRQKYNDGTKTIPIASYLFSTWTDSYQLSLYGADVFAEGAALASYHIGIKLPSFRQKLIPVELYTVGRNKSGDRTEKWETLVASGTLPAGEIYHHPKPIQGLFIPEGKEHLELTLKRPAKDGSFLYRSVIAKIPQKTEKKEPVVISTNIRPGQGFAQVLIDSRRPGVFSTRLDWHTMKTTTKPELKLEYIPEVAYIVSDYNLWNNVQYAMSTFVQNWQNSHIIYDWNTKELLNSLNRWRMDKDSSDIFRHIGPLNSDGSIQAIRNKSLFEDFLKTLDEAWKHEYDAKIKRRLLRLAGWLYLYIPQTMLQEAEYHIAYGKPQAIHLHIAGLTFHTEKHFTMFYKNFRRQYEPTAEWFRALRNMVRFRDHALSDEVVSKEEINHILQIIIRNLTYKNGIRKYNNCIEALIYLLKRRRYDDDFLAPGAEDTQTISALLRDIANNHKTAKYRKIAQATRAFLNKEATSANLTAILEAEEEENGDNEDE